MKRRILFPFFVLAFFLGNAQEYSGFILKTGSGKSYDKEHFALKLKKNVGRTVYFDNKKSIAKNQKNAVSVKAEYQNNLEVDPAILQEYG